MTKDLFPALPGTDFSLGLWHIACNQPCLSTDFSKNHQVPVVVKLLTLV